MYKEDVIHIYNGILAIKKNKIMPFAATWMDLEIVILSEVRQSMFSDHSGIKLEISNKH